MVLLTNLFRYKDPENYPGNYEIWFNTQDQNNSFEDAENVNISLEDGCHPRGVRWGDVVGLYYDLPIQLLSNNADNSIECRW